MQTLKSFIVYGRNMNTTTSYGLYSIVDISYDLLQSFMWPYDVCIVNPHLKIQWFKHKYVFRTINDMKQYHIFPINCADNHNKIKESHTQYGLRIH